ncbi:MAG: glycosyltransferase family 2 protein [Ilumatobacter sp.]|uniref:glycosyltransferase family 2 protein n=1 Tax=Ilumatobacter sp. TaxID=1967498 RepID=UPI003919356E
MLVSIIIPSFEQSQFLLACIESARSQDHTDLEILVVDDASSDASLAIAREIALVDDRIRIIRRTRNGGLGRARNTGIAFARGELLGFLDSDDCLYPDSVSARVDAYLAASVDQPGLIGVFGDWQHTTEAVDLPARRDPRESVPDVTAESFRGENGFICSAPLVRADVVRSVGGFPEGLPLFEDFSMWTRILATGGFFRYVPSVVSTYRQRPMSMLRRADVIGATYADSIVGDAVERGISLAGSNMLGLTAEFASPRSGQRLSWLRSTQFGTNLDQEFGDAAAILTGGKRRNAAEPEPPQESAPFVQRAAGSLDDAANDAVEMLTADLPDNDESVIVVSPSSIEDAFEIVAIAEGWSGKQRLVVALNEGTALSDLWPIAGYDLPVTTADNAIKRWPGAQWMVFGSDDGERGQIVRRIGKQRCTIRSTGLTALRTFENGAARRFREASHTIVRNELEAAELGDRSVEIVRSGVAIGARHIFESQPGLSPNGPIVVFVPDGFLDEPYADGWLSTALATADSFPNRSVLASKAMPASKLGGFRVRPLSLRLLGEASAIVLPICDELPMFEALGLRVVVFDPALSDTLNLTLVRHLAPAQNSASLRRILTQTLTGSSRHPDEFATRLSRFFPHDGNASEFVSDLFGDSTEHDHEG